MPDRYTRYAVTLLGNLVLTGERYVTPYYIGIRCNVTPHWTANEERNVQ